MSSNTKKPTESTVDIRDVDVPEGYVFSDIPKSRIEAISRDIFGYDKLIIRSALEAYIRSWLDSDGVNRLFFGDIIPPVVNYVTDKHFDQAEDPITKRVLLARLFSELRQSVPAILITDTGTEYRSPGIGDYTKSYFDPELNQHIISLTTIADISMEIVLISQDEETTQILYSIMLHIFGSVRRLGRGNVLKSKDPKHKWVLRLPLQFSEGGIQQQAVLDDPKDQFWTGSLSLTTQYEAVRRIGYKNVLMFNPWDKPGGIDSFPGDSNVFGSFKPKILGPARMRVNVPQRAEVIRMLRTYRLVVDKPGIAIINQETYMITPRRPGKFKLLITRDATDENNRPEVLDSLEIEVGL